MVACNRTDEFLLLVFFLAVSCITTTSAQYKVPIPQFEALERGGFRVYIPASKDTTRFRFNANINEDLPRSKTGKVSGEADSPVNGVFMLEFNDLLNVGDTINYRLEVYKGVLGYRREGLIWTVAKSDLKDEYSPFGPSCRESFTTENGQASCIGKTILLDEFNGQSIDTNKWIIEQMIPTYEGPNYEFNSYENIDSTRFIQNGILYLKPNPILNENDVRTPLDLRNGCTTNNSLACHYVPRGAFFAPPVKSARITSKQPFKYGKIEIKAKLPAGDWVFPVIELQMKDKLLGTSSPKVIIAYSRGNDKLVHNGEDIGSHALYAGPVLTYQEPGRSSRLEKHAQNTPLHNDFHIFKLDWEPGKMSFYVESNRYCEVSTRQGFPEFQKHSTAPEAPYDREYVLSLGVAVGGLNDFPDDVSGGNPKPWINDERNTVKSFFDQRDTWSSTWKGNNAALQIDYVKITAI